jgi:tight adherence protein B
MKLIFAALIIFILTVFVIEMLFYAYRIIRHPHRTRIRRRLRALTSDEIVHEGTDITRRRVLSDVPLFNRILWKVAGVERLDRLLQHADAQYPLGVFILLSIVLGFVGFLGCQTLRGDHALSFVIAMILGLLPFAYLIIKKKRRMDKFQKQFPEALELIARALKAGHAFPSGMKLAADEFDSPLGTEFEETLNEINFGLSVTDALKNFSERVDCTELKYFVVSVILQRETGGNLAEIIENLALIIRERFKLRGRIRVLSAEGRFSATLLVALPVLAIIALRFLNPDYVNTLFSQPAGQIMAGAAGLMMVIGILVIRRIVNFRV